MLNPIAFSVFGISVFWYGIVYFLGFLLTYVFILYFGKKKGFLQKDLEDIFLIFTIFSIIGGRFFYVLFYNLDYYISRPFAVFAVWEGGMSIHGGLFFGILSLYLFSKLKRFEGLKILKILDLFAVPLGLFLAFGRLANFINQELVGKVTNSFLGVVFPNYDSAIRHPVVLYESVLDFVLFQISLYLFFFKKLKSGTIFCFVLICYSLGRFFIDFFRVYENYYFGLFSMGQIFCVLYLVFGVFVYLRFVRTQT